MGGEGAADWSTTGETTVKTKAATTGVSVMTYALRGL